MNKFYKKCCGWEVRHTLVPTLPALQGNDLSRHGKKSDEYKPRNTFHKPPTQNFSWDEPIKICEHFFLKMFFLKRNS